jgi:hypothetical protein
MTDDRHVRHHQFEEVLQYLQALRRKGFYGTIHLGFQRGEITQIESKTVSKPGDTLA